jgi:hypothetical protein
MIGGVFGGTGWTETQLLNSTAPTVNSKKVVSCEKEGFITYRF